MTIEKKGFKKSFFLFSLAFTALLFLLFACEKEETTDFVNKAVITSDHITLDLETIRLTALFHKAIFDTALMNHDSALIDSALVTLTFDSLNNKKNFTFDFGNGISGPDWKVRSGKIEANLSGDFTAESSNFLAHFVDYKYEQFGMEGELLFTNTGQVGSGNTFYTLTANFESSDESGNSFVQTGTKYLIWTEGESNPQNWQEHEFTISGDASAYYTHEGPAAISEARITTTIVNDWILRLSCGKAIHAGSLSSDFVIEQNSEIITGEFIDSDIDGCSDKVILKNSQNFGYPFYI